MPGARALSASRSYGPVRWVFLDRDGTLNVKAAEGEYVQRPEDLKLLPGVAGAVRDLNHAGMWTGVVTNQRGVALGRMSTDDLGSVHERLEQLLSSEGAFLDAIYVCPHHAGVCQCRKPNPGMLLKAQSDYPGLDFSAAVIVGDSLSDMEAGRRVGASTVLIAAAQPAAGAADHVVADMVAAARLLVGDRDRLGHA